VHAASRALGISQPALTRSIQILEKMLDVSLLRRESHRVFPTPAGAVFYEEACLVLNECARAQQEAARAQFGQLGEVNLGIGGMFANYVIDAAIAQISSQFPDLRLKVKEGLFEDNVHDLHLGKLDLVFSNFPRVKTNDSVVLEPLLELHHMVFVSSHHRLASKHKVKLADTIDEHWLAIDQLHGTLGLNAGFAQADLPIPQHVIFTNSLTLIRKLVAGGNYIVALSKEFFESELRDGTVKRLNLPQFMFPRRAGLVYRKAAYRSPAVEHVMDAIRAVCERQRLGKRARG
jgi:DNA-binding transcriptional LysR family regulator